MPVWLMILAFFVSFLGVSISLRLMIPLLQQAGLTGRDLHKPSQPEIPEMGGLGIVVGLSAGLVITIGAEAFLEVGVDVVPLLAVLSTILIVSFVGVFDDLLGISQLVKSFSPVLASLPLMAIRGGQTVMVVPLIGQIEFGLIYPLVLVPLGITGAANAANMLAGFNGLEVGLGMVVFISLAVVAGFSASWTAFVILIVGIGGLLAALRFNWYPAKALIGDVGTLTIGATMASAVIIGNFETAGVVLIVPYFIDFLFKAGNGFPSSGWSGKLRAEDDRLYCESDQKPVSLPQLVMKIAGGLTERNLVLTLLGIEAVFGTVAILLYLLW